MNTPWFPLPEGLRGICELLIEHQKPTSDHTKIYRRLEEYSASPEFSNYLVYLFAEGEEFSIEARQTAGLWLKNKIKTQFRNLPEANQLYLQTSLLKALTLNSSILRQTASTVVSTIVSISRIQPWSDLTRFLMEALDTDQEIHNETALDTLSKICEDSPELFEVGFLQESGNEMLIRILSQLLNPKTQIRRLALTLMNLLLGRIPSSRIQLLEMFREALLRLFPDRETSVQKEVCYGLTQLLLFHEEVVVSCLDEVIGHMLDCSRHPDQTVAIEACEFWTSFLDSSMEPWRLKPHLKTLIPILLSNMVYEENDEAIIACRQAEVDQSDKESEIRPFHPNQSVGIDEGDLEEDGEVEGAWTLRKCSAAGLDKLSLIYGDELLPEILPLVDQKLQDSDWRVRESGILVLGAISEGCKHGLAPSLDKVLSYVLEKALDPEPMVRIISCWVLSRYTRRIVNQTPEPSSQSQAIFQTLFKCLKDGNKQVQESACSALATIVEIGGEVVYSRLEAILQELAGACWRYGKKNLRFVYDAISTLAETVGRPMSEAKHRQIIMIPLLTHYEKFIDQDKALQPLLNCLTTLAVAFGDAFEEYSGPVFARCLRLLSQKDQSDDNSFVVSALDLVCGLVEGLRMKMDPLIRQSNLLELLIDCCQSAEDDIRQSAFGLVGELAKTLPELLKPHLPTFLFLTVNYFSPGLITEASLSACNNACWSFGMLVLRCSEEDIQSVSMKGLENCVSLMMNSTSLPRILVENAAITLGRLSLLCAKDFSPYLHTFLSPWCEMLRNVRDDIEKEQAFIGLFKTLKYNTDCAADCFPSVCLAVASWSCGMSPQLKEEIKMVLCNLKQTLEARSEWERVWNLVPQSVRQKLDTPGVL